MWECWINVYLRNESGYQYQWLGGYMSSREQAVSKYAIYRIHVKLK